LDTHTHTHAPNAFPWEMENGSVSARLTGVTQISARDDKNQSIGVFTSGSTVPTA